MSGWHKRSGSQISEGLGPSLKKPKVSMSTVPTLHEFLDKLLHNLLNGQESITKLAHKCQSSISQIPDGVGPDPSRVEYEMVVVTVAKALKNIGEC